MKILFKIIFLLALYTPAHSFATEIDFGRYTKEKVLHKEYTLMKGAQVAIENRYGTIDIKSWDRSSVSIKVTIRTTGNNESSVENKLDDIGVQFNGNESSVSAKTTIEEDHFFSFWGLFGSNVNYTINYEIRVPSTAFLNLKNSYGDIYLDKTEVKTWVKCRYGSVDLGDLNAEENYIELDYNSHSKIHFMKGGKVDIDYSDLEIIKADQLEIVSDYSEVFLGAISQLSYDFDYGKLSVKESENIHGDSDYTDISLENIYKSALLSADYGKLEIESFGINAQEVTLDTDYTNVSLGYISNNTFRFEINSNYTDVKGLDPLNLNVVKEKSNTKYYQGSYGNSTQETQLSVKSTYGSLKFIKKNH